MSVSRLYRIRVAGVTAEPEQGALFHLQQHSVTLGAGIVRRLAQLKHTCIKRLLLFRDVDLDLDFFRHLKRSFLFCRLRR